MVRIKENGLVMRVLIVTGSFPPMKCGVGDYVFSLADAIASIPSVHVGVLTSTSAKPVVSLSRVDVLPVINSWHLGNVLKFCKKMRAWSPDIVHIQYPSHGYDRGLMPSLLPLVSVMMNIKVVQTWHEFECRGFKSLIKLILRGTFTSGHIVVVREKYKDDLPKILRLALWLKRFTFIQNGASIEKKFFNSEETANARKKYLKGQQRLIVFFGFIYPHKGVELLFAIANPETDRIVIAGGFDEQSEYFKTISQRGNETPWVGKVDFLGFVPTDQVSELLAVADAVVLPFRENGGGEWNSSIHAAVAHSSFVLTTSVTKTGYEKSRNIFYAGVDNISEMRDALDLYAGVRRNDESSIDGDEWKKIGEEHVRLYLKILKKTAIL